MEYASKSDILLPSLPTFFSFTIILRIYRDSDFINRFSSRRKTLLKQNNHPCYAFVIESLYSFALYTFTVILLYTFFSTLDTVMLLKGLNCRNHENCVQRRNCHLFSGVKCAIQSRCSFTLKRRGSYSADTREGVEGGKTHFSSDTSVHLTRFR